MCKKAFSVLLALALAAAIPVGYALAESDYDVKAKLLELQKSIDELAALIKDLSFQVEQNQALAGIVKELSFQLKKSESALRSLQGLQEKVEGEVQPHLLVLDSQIDSLGASLEERIRTLGARVYEAETSIQQLDARIKANEERLRRLNGVLDQIQGLEERITTLELAAKYPEDIQAFDKLVAQVQGLKEDVGALSLSVDGQRGRIAALETAVSGLEAAQADFATLDELSDVRMQMGALEEELQAAKAQAGTNFLVALLGVLAGIAAMGLVLLGTP